MKNKALKIIINAVIGIISVALFVLLFLDLIDRLWEAVLYSALGIVAVYVINALFHELAHVVSGAVMGLKPYSVQILNLFIGREDNGKFKVCFKRSQGELGNTVFIPKTSEDVFKKHVICAAFGILANLLIMVVQCSIALTTTNFFVYAFFGVTFPLTLYILLVNLIPLFGGDGALIMFYFKADKELVVAKNYFKLSADLMLGTLPENLDSTLLIKMGDGDYSVGIRYLRYLAYLKNDEESAFKELSLMPELQEDNPLSNEIFKEKFFMALLQGNKNYVSEFADLAVTLLEKQTTPSDYRIHAVYRIKTGELEWAKLILNSGIKFCENYPNKGVALSEKDYMQTLKNQLN